ncbi:MAG: DNA-binding transcriptional regulator Fis [Gammaproteobacteria bacterium]|nr:DNA-binding transcriptional regulator Fis [Gammaproteobacteria bacterium]
MTEMAVAHDQNTTKTNGQTLRDSVKSTVEAYLKQLDGHPAGQLYEMFLQEVETPLLEAVMTHVRGNQSKAAELLGINRGTLRKKLKIYGLHL